MKITELMESSNLLAQYKENENNNAHTENYLILAQEFGTPKQVQQVKQLLRKRDHMGYTDPADMNWMQDNLGRFHRQLMGGSVMSRAEQQSNDDHEAWKEKTAAARQGRHYHELFREDEDGATKYGIWATVSGGVTGTRQAWAKKDGERIEVDSYEEAQQIARDYMNRTGPSSARFHYTPKPLLHESKRTEHKGYYGKDGTWFPNEEEYAASLKGDPNVEREESKKKVAEARAKLPGLSPEDFEAYKSLSHSEKRTKYKAFGRLGRHTSPDQVMMHMKDGSNKHDWGFDMQFPGYTQEKCYVCGRTRYRNKNGHVFSR